MSKLINLARKMQKEAKANGKRQITLKHGLTLTLRYARPTDTWLLSMTRKNVRPGENEVDICREAFEVPGDANRQDHAHGPYQIIRLSWRDPVVAQTEMFPGIKPTSYYND